MSLPIWIVVANGSRARLLQRNGHSQALTEVHGWTHPATREHRQQETHGQRPGGIRGRSALAEHSTPQDKQRSAFAHEICQWLLHAVSTQEVASIALLASNPFLGELVAHGQSSLHKHLIATHAVDLTSLPLDMLGERLHQDYRL